MGLFDMILIKDNHWATMREPRNLWPWVTKFKKQHPDISIEIEVETPAQLDEALVAEPHIILLDNMAIDRLRDAVKRRNTLAPKVLLEASGGVTLQTVRAIAETGVDRISVGAITHSAPALDIALDYEHAG
jgi:nicotinate-nucleotide pyrophosphorylase (carboxylating)